MTNSPENDGGGSASRTGPRRASRALNSDFVDIEELYYPLSQFTQRREPENIWPGSLYIQSLCDEATTLQDGIEHDLYFDSAIRQQSKCKVAGFHSQIEKLPSALHGRSH